MIQRPQLFYRKTPLQLFFPFLVQPGFPTQPFSNTSPKKNKTKKNHCSPLHWEGIASFKTHGPATGTQNILLFHFPDGLNHTCQTNICGLQDLPSEEMESMCCRRKKRRRGGGRRRIRKKNEKKQKYFSGRRTSFSEKTSERTCTWNFHCPLHSRILSPNFNTRDRITCGPDWGNVGSVRGWMVKI